VRLTAGAKPQPSQWAHDMSFAAETTADPHDGNERNFFKVERRSRDD
jgi:hypothetical protein